MTWKELQIICLQKMFAISGDILVKDDATLPYLSSMPGVVNEALQLLATAGRFLKKKIVIQQGFENTAPTETAGRYLKYDLKTLVPDFYSLFEQAIYLESGQEYGKAYDYAIENESVFVLDGGLTGRWTVYYNAYPQKITATTPDDEELSIHPEAVVLIPLYVASQLYKEDDIGFAVQCRNEFESAREILLAQRDSLSHSGHEGFTSANGWY